MKKILFIITRGDIIGGAQSHLLIICKNFILKGVDVKVIVGGTNTILKKKLEEFNIQTIEIKHLKRDISLYNDFISLLKIIWFVFKYKPNLISSHSSKAGILSRFASFISKVPVVFTAHGWAFTEGVNENKRKKYIKIESFLAKITDKIIAVSNYDYNLAIKEKVCNFSKIHMIHNGIDTTSIIKIPNENTIVNLVMVARFDIPKDQLKLIKAVSELNNVNLFLIGDGPNLQECISFVNNNNLNNKITFMGYVDNVINFLIDMDIFILISNYEGFPISTIEAMSVGLPIIISNVGGASEAIVNGKNGFVVENNIYNIKNSILTLVNNIGLRKEMGKQSLLIFNENFTSKKMVDETFALFESII